MKFYVGNPTHQKHIFSWVHPGTGRVRNIELASGSQALIGDFPTEEIEGIIEQKRVFGFRSIHEAVRQRSYNTLCYATDAPIPKDKLDQAVAINHSALTQRGESIRRKSAVDAGQAMRINAEAAGVGLGIGETETRLRHETENGETPDFDDRNIVTDNSESEFKARRSRRNDNE